MVEGPLNKFANGFIGGAEGFSFHINLFLSIIHMELVVLVHLYRFSLFTISRFCCSIPSNRDIIHLVRLWSNNLHRVIVRFPSIYQTEGTLIIFACSSSFPAFSFDIVNTFFAFKLPNAYSRLCYYKTCILPRKLNYLFIECGLDCLFSDVRRIEIVNVVELVF